MTTQETHAVQSDDDVVAARDKFRAALSYSHATRGGIAELEASAATFCLLMRQAGHTPERTVIDAKAVIEETIDGHDATLAERAVSRCIEHYFDG
ncbi:MAG: hypothetical protein ABIY52_06350 [Gemmatimonadaceae bacterium]